MKKKIKIPKIIHLKKEIKDKYISNDINYPIGFVKWSN